MVKRQREFARRLIVSMAARDGSALTDAAECRFADRICANERN